MCSNPSNLTPGDCFLLMLTYEYVGSELSCYAFSNTVILRSSTLGVDVLVISGDVATDKRAVHTAVPEVK